jgi:ATP-dependent helicase/DNAse subunit B
LEQSITAAKAANQLAQKRFSRTQLKWALERAWSRLPLPHVSGADAGVQILDAKALAGREFAHLFLVGLESDRFPRRGTRTSLLSEETQWQLNRWAKRSIFPVRDAEAADLLGWVQAFGTARDGLTLSFSRAGWGGEGKSPADPLRALAQAVGLAIPEVARVRFELNSATTEVELRAAAAVHMAEDAESRAVVEQVLGEEPWLRDAQKLAALETERLRFFSEPEAAPGRHSGAVLPTDSLAQSLRFGPDRPLSASSLGRWGNCAQQGFLTSLLRLEPRETASEDMAPRVQGIFWHTVLEQLVARLPASVRTVSPTLLDEVLDRVTQDLQSRGLACHPALWSLARQSARQMVQRLVKTGGLFPYPQLVPEGVEVAFGSARSKEIWRSVALPGSASEPPVHFEGKIDRLDAGPNGAAVMDYKSGGPRSDRDALDDLLVTQFQLPLYLYAARAAGHSGALRASWISLKTGEVRELNPLLEKVGQTVEGLLATSLESRAEAADRGLPNLANAIHALLAPLRQGQFPARSHDCRGCGMEAVCRVTARRAEDAS